MMKRIAQTHAPATLPQEAALLPALPARKSSKPRNLMIPPPDLVFRPVMAEAEPTPKASQAAPRRRGSAAGRAILHAAGVSVPGVTAMSRTFVQESSYIE